MKRKTTEIIPILDKLLELRETYKNAYWNAHAENNESDKYYYQGRTASMQEAYDIITKLAYNE